MRLIEADTLKDNFCFLRKMWSETEISAVIDNAPTVEAVEVVHGCMRHVFCSYQDNHFQCTCCNGNFITNAARYWNYCPNCGAKMMERNKKE